MSFICDAVCVDTGVKEEGKASLMIHVESDENNWEVNFQGSLMVFLLRDLYRACWVSEKEKDVSNFAEFLKQMNQSFFSPRSLTQAHVMTHRQWS